MAHQQVSLELVRDGHCTPWGFRLTGGADIGVPLHIQKVSLGSPAEGELHRGDVLVAIREQDATRLSHQGATDLICKAGSTLKLVVARNAHVSHPGSPVPSVDFGCFRPLPTSQGRHRRTSTESFSSNASNDENIANQPYRSTPLILPGAKITKDVPVGSYLRFDPISKMTSTPPSSSPKFGEYYMLNKVQEALTGAAPPSSGMSSPGRTATPDLSVHNGTQFLRQYNSPIHMYSNQAIVEALAAQTVGLKTAPIHLTADILETNKLDNIKNSPTYQLIHDQECRKGPVLEHGPLEERVYNVPPRSGLGQRPDDIHQSGSFKSIMHDLKGMSDF